MPISLPRRICQGHVIKEDYDSVLIPVVNAALKNQGKVRLNYETVGDFLGIDSCAIWEDFKVRVEHFSRWERIAVVTYVEGIKQTM